MKKLIAFFEIPASDFHRAVDFYETVLGMQLPTFECETEKMACFTEEGETVGAISYASNFDFLPSTHGVLIHFNCEEIEQTLEKVLLKGGKVVIPRTKIEAGRCVKMHTFCFLRTKPRLSQAGALLLPKDFVSLGIRISL